ncbi:hypothetical protein [Paenibacillus dendritiformis]|uniref:hypothetical protein n=1 Tax=Paenibacillus dendritiformis TaxID=130049 RepID=UPI00387E1A89
MGNIIDEVSDLLKLDEEELTEKLLSEKYNKANLRELVRRCLKEVHEYKVAFYFEKQEHENFRNNINELISKIKN